MSRIFFDLGNTRVKWWREQGEPARGVFDYANTDMTLKQFVSNNNATHAIYASVVKDSRQNAFTQALQKMHLRSARCVVASEALGVRCAYQDVSRFGIDRWLAVLAGWHYAQGPVVVVDLGTAATFDFVDAHGQHLGGYILPGLRLGVSALLQGTNNVIVDFDKLNADDVGPGANTTDAVYHGALFAMKSLLESAFRSLVNRAPAAKLLITGGDADLIAPLLECQHQKIEDLVFVGMRMLADANQVVEEPAQE